MPRVGQLSAAEVWAAATRTLSALTGQPRTDLVGSDAALWSAAARTLTSLAIQDLVDIPIPASVYPPVHITAAATADAFGPWAQILADVGSGKQLAAIVVDMISVTDRSFELELGAGAQGAEVAFWRCSFHSRWRTDAGVASSIVVPVGVQLAASSRLSGRLRNSAAETNQVLVSPQVV